MFETNFDFDYNSYKLTAVIDCFHSEEEELRMELIGQITWKDFMMNLCLPK